VLLLLASCYFYLVFKPVFILILFLTIVIDYFAGIWIEQSSGRKRWWLLVVSIISNVGILAFFKYFNFAIENFNKVFFKLGAGFTLPNLDTLLPPNIAQYMSEAGHVILPIGLSFHTFQAMSYTIEVYRKNQKAERHFGIYALYVMFYPQLVAGPIERPQNVLPQFHQYFEYDWENVKAGLMRMAFGFFKKVVIADRLALMAGPAYEHPENHNGLTLLVATFFYTFRIYCDFSGYSDIALGAAQTMGFKLMENFKTPYVSRSIAEFWNRWHLSLSTWFRDYLYISMGGNRQGEARAYFNRMTVFLVSGLWHGASWNFVIWGGLHGAYLIGASLRDKWLQKLNIKMPTAVWYGWLQGLLTFGLVMLTWVFFAVGGQRDGGSVRESVLILKKIASLSWQDSLQSALKPIEMWFCMLLIGFLMLKEHFYLDISTRRDLRFFVLFGALVLICYFFGVFNSNQFIYFQF
jgi:alginate O-acetyltransferase complex protein AlgI